MIEPVQRKLQFVFEKFGIRPISNITLNYFSMANEVFTFETEKSKYVLKNCLKNNSRKLLANELALTNLLNSHGCACPEMITAENGESVVEYRDQLFVLNNFFEGRTPNWTDDLHDFHVDEATRGLALFHKATADFELPHDSGRIKCYEMSRIRSWLSELKLQLDQNGRVSSKQMNKLLPEFNALADQLETQFAADNFMATEQVIHGDFHCFNLFYENEQFKGCCDFDFIRHDLRLFDIAWFLQTIHYRFYLYGEYGDDFSENGLEPDPELVSQMVRRNVSRFLDFYRQSHQISDAEIRLLPLVMQSIPLFNMRFFSLNNSEEECLEHVSWFAWSLKNTPNMASDFQSALDIVLK